MRTPKPEPVKVPVIYKTHAQTVCSDCGTLGCWIPTKHRRVTA